jgi:hypothetical protein
MTEEIELKIYGAEPCFIFDPDDTSNAPVPGINNNAIVRWPLYPSYLRDKFTEAFSKTALADPSFRVIEKEWLRTFIRLRGEIYKCDCGEVFFADPVNPVTCPTCGKEHKLAGYISIGKYNLAIHRRTKLYACHTDADSDDYSDLTAEVALNEQTGALELKNRSKKSWLVIDSTGKQFSRGPGKTAPLTQGTRIVFGTITAAVM